MIQSFSGHTVSLWHFSLSGRDIIIIPQDTVYSIAFFPGNSQWVITSSQDKSVRVWDIRTGVWQLIVQGHTRYG